MEIKVEVQQKAATDAEFPSSYIAEIIDSSVKKVIETQATEDLIKEFGRDEKKQIKSHKKEIVEYLKSKINCTKKQLLESQADNKTKLNKDK